jgi:hypothetical protein
MELTLLLLLLLLLATDLSHLARSSRLALAHAPHGGGMELRQTPAFRFASWQDTEPPHLHPNIVCEENLAALEISVGGRIVELLTTPLRSERLVRRVAWASSRK